MFVCFSGFRHKQTIFSTVLAEVCDKRIACRVYLYFSALQLCRSSCLPVTVEYSRCNGQVSGVLNRNVTSQYTLTEIRNVTDDGYCH